MINTRGHPGGRHRTIHLPKLSHFSLFQARGEVVLHRIYRKNIPKGYHFSLKLQKMVRTSPCFKFVGFPLNTHYKNKSYNKVSFRYTFHGFVEIFACTQTHLKFINEDRVVLYHDIKHKAILYFL